VLAGFLSVVNALGSPPADKPAWVGVDCNYILDMTAAKKSWRDGSGPVDPFTLFAKQGCQVARVRLWVGGDGSNRLNQAIETALRAQRAGLKPLLVVFLSEEWADLVKQPAPRAWRNLPFEQKLAAVEAYSEQVARRFADAGISLETFEIGNEIDFGLCGEFEEEWPKRVSREYMSQRVWPRVAALVQAAEAGIRKVQPSARFVLHLAQWNKPDDCIAFWKAMLDAGTQLDYLGLSYFPTSSETEEQRPLDYLRRQTAKIFEAIPRPVLICECGYPASAEFDGQFATWKRAVDGFPLTDDGQARWIDGLIKLVESDPHFLGVIYWSPEWYSGGLWDAFALFDANGVARPGVRSLGIRGSTAAGTKKRVAGVDASTGASPP
jgi:arabinogalactan endo-1,4-beta-galactosidase